MQKKLYYQSKAKIQVLLFEGVWNEICADIQNWRKKLKVDLSDLIDITISIKSETECELMLKATKAGSSMPYGTDSKTIDLQKMVGLPGATIHHDDVWHLLKDGIQYMVGKIQLNSMSVWDNAADMAIQFK